MAVKELPPPDLLRKVIDYCPDTGRMIWKKRGPELFDAPAEHLQRVMNAWNSRFSDKAACLRKSTSGYYVSCILGDRYAMHRIAWAMHYGVAPQGQIDHINGDRTDNRITNLRQVTNAENGRNQKMRSTNTTGVTGVYKVNRKKPWIAIIGVNGKNRHLGYYETMQDAAMARKRAERLYDYHPNHGINRDHLQPPSE
jgi:hypothetical protein